ncbi:MAG TPA: methyltransferase domain-containing protein [Herpetosiphonaceae bacterium]|nr:methyltransferase domain-containing protein [Herpetosiphonaceae bacterium]
MRVARQGLALVPRLFGYEPRTCNVCGHTGRFLAEIHFPDVFTYDAVCARCGSLPRNRLALFLIEREHLLKGTDRLLHFAPEACLRGPLAAKVSEYLTADINPVGVDQVLNIEAIDLPDQSVDAIYCSHVLEHVDHHAALNEFRRVLAPGGRALCLFPYYPSWQSSYEDPALPTPRERAIHFGKDNHLRRFGSDIQEAVGKAGLDLRLLTAPGAETVAMGLISGETLFVLTRP